MVGKRNRERKKEKAVYIYIYIYRGEEKRDDEGLPYDT